MREGQKESSGRSNSFSDLSKEEESDGRDSLTLQLGADQADRLVTHGSHGDKQGDVYPILP